MMTFDEALDIADAAQSKMKRPDAKVGNDWLTIETAPKDGSAFQARIPGHGSDNIIAWLDGLLNSASYKCGGWFFVEDQEPPDDWTDGVCWDVNADGKKSVGPTHWKPLSKANPLSARGFSSAEKVTEACLLPASVAAISQSVAALPTQAAEPDVNPLASGTHSSSGARDTGSISSLAAREADESAATQQRRCNIMTYLILAALFPIWWAATAMALRASK